MTTAASVESTLAVLPEHVILDLRHHFAMMLWLEQAEYSEVVAQLSHDYELGDDQAHQIAQYLVKLGSIDRIKRVLVESGIAAARSLDATRTTRRSQKLFRKAVDRAIVDHMRHYARSYSVHYAHCYCDCAHN